jgi:hypothetical protein
MRGRIGCTARKCRQNGEIMKYLLLILPSVISLCVPFYNVTEPRLFGFPFFYWLLLSLIPLSSLLTFIVYKGEKR